MKDMATLFWNTGTFSFRFVSSKKFKIDSRPVTVKLNVNPNPKGDLGPILQNSIIAEMFSDKIFQSSGNIILSNNYRKQIFKMDTILGFRGSKKQ
jgi:hypothetical protein